MKRSIVILILCAVLEQFANAQWEDLSNSSLGQILDCKFVSATTGWIVNLSNTPPQGLLHTSNGGQTWTKILDHPPGVLNWLADFDFLDGSLGYVTALNGQRFRTFNGGRTWDTLTSHNEKVEGGNDDDKSLKIFSYRLAYSFGFERSVDTFRTWEPIGSLPPNSSPSRAYYVDAGRIILAGTLECYRSIDSGFTWQRTFFDSMFVCKALAFGNDSIGYALSILLENAFPRAMTLKTTDAGATWFDIPARIVNGGGIDVLDAYFQNPNVGFACGDNGLARTTDGGLTWNGVANVNGALLSMSWPDSMHGWAVGYGGKVYRTTNGGGLPIQLVSFTGHHVGGTRVRLDWRTLTETGNLGFYIERRTASDTTFTQISQLIPGYGTTNEPHDYTWMDTNATIARWYYRLKQVDLSGPAHYTEPIIVDVTTGVSEQYTPHEFRLEQNYPNPFNPTTTITFSVGTYGHTSLRVYDVLGREVATLVSETKQAGKYETTFDGSTLSSGVYIYKLKVGDFTAIKRMLLVK